MGGVNRILAVLDWLAERTLLPLSIGGLVLGLVLAAAGRADLAQVAWSVPSLIVGVWLLVSIIRDLLHGEAGVDVIAVLAIGGALLFNEALTASVIGVMLATGDALERYADGRAHRELSSLISRAPRLVHRHEGGAIEDRPVAEVVVGDRILVKPGEVIAG